MTGKVSYAVLAFGSFLGLGNDHYPIPWASLKYDTSLGGFRTAVTEQQLAGAPKYASDSDWSWGRQHKNTRCDYYGVPLLCFQRGACHPSLAFGCEDGFLPFSVWQFQSHRSGRLNRRFLASALQPSTFF